MANGKLASLAQSSLIMTAGTLASRILGFVKTMFLAAAIGVTVGGAADAFDIANKVPNSLYMLLAGGVLNAVLVPQIIRATKRADGGSDFVNRLLTLSIGLLLIFTLIATACAGLLVKVYASPSWPPEQTALATAFAYWCLPQIFFYGLYTLLGQVLNAKKSFGPYMWAPVLNNLVAIAGLVVFIWLFGPGAEGQHTIDSWDSTKIAVLAGSATIGVVSQALILLIPLRRLGFKFTPTFGWRGMGFGSASRVAGWTFAALLVGQLGFVVISQVASTATSADAGSPSASNAAYTVGFLVFMLPHSLAAVSIATALFTTMSEQAAERNIDGVRRSFSLGVRIVAVINFFATAAFLVLAPQTGLLIAGGTREQGESIGWVIRAMILGLIPFSTNYLMQRVFYAFEDAKTPFVVQLPQIILTSAGVIAAAFLPRDWIVAGIGIAMSAGYFFGAIFSGILLRRRLHRLDMKAIAVNHVKLAVAALVAMAAGFALLAPMSDFSFTGQLNSLVTIAAVGAVMLVVYLIVALLLKVRELSEVIRAVRTKLGR